MGVGFWVKNFLQKSGKIAILLTIIRIYLGISWMLQGSGKISSKTFDATMFLKSAVEKATITGMDATVQGWWAFIVKTFFLPNVDVINYLVPVSELFVGIALISGTFTRRALYVALLFNFMYLLSGSLAINPQMILLSLFLLKTGENSGRIGIDGWIISNVKKRIHASSANA